MTKTFQFVLRTPEKEIENREVFSLRLSTEGGEMMVYPGHADLSGVIHFSRVEVKGKDFEETYVVRRGLVFVSLNDNKTTIMAYSCEKVDDVSFESVEEYLQMVEEELRKGPEHLSEFQLRFLEGEKLAVSKQLKSTKS